MAKTGFEYICYGKLGANESSPTYTGAKYLGASSTFNGSVTSSDVKDWGDDMMQETDKTVSGGTISIELNEMTGEIYADILGHDYDSENDEVVSNANDVAPFLGIGAVGKSRRKGARKYTGKFYFKTQFNEPGDDNATKQENVSFTHTTLEGSIIILENGDWKKQAEFDTLAEAKAWLDKLLGKTNPA